VATILVTGGAGYVGSVCCARLRAFGHHVEAVDNLCSGHADNIPPGVKLHQFDIGDYGSLSNLLARNKFEVVFHFAATALVPESVSNPGPFFENNVAKGIALLEVLRKHHIRKFVFSSTAAVYGAPQVVPIPEEHSKQPLNAYGESKLIFESILRWYASAYGWSVVAFRYFNACGGGPDWGERHEPETHVIPLLLQTASGRKPFFNIYGTEYPTPDGTCLRDYVHVFDIADAHLLALQKVGQRGLWSYNIGTGTTYSVRDLWKKAEKITRKKIDARLCPPRPGDPSVLCANPKKLMDELGWTPAHSDLEDILTGAWQWEQHQCERDVGGPYISGEVLPATPGE
jgi:UDP-glucose 4-epimerase